MESHENRKIIQGKQSSSRWLLFLYPKGGIDVNLEKQADSRMPEKRSFMKMPALAGRVYVIGMMSILMSQTAYADIFDTAKTAMQQVYTDVAGIATVGAVVCAAVCLFLMNFSKSGKTVDESRAWLKRIVICWAALMTLGAIVTYMESIIPQSMFSP